MKTAKRLLRHNNTAVAVTIELCVCMYVCNYASAMISFYQYFLLSKEQQSIFSLFAAAFMIIIIIIESKENKKNQGYHRFL